MLVYIYLTFTTFISDLQILTCELSHDCHVTIAVAHACKMAATGSSSSTVDIQAIAGAVAASVQQALQTQSSSAQPQENHQPPGR